MIESALVVREPWIGLILAGRKTWEMRSQNTNKRGLLGLIRQSSGLVVGIARLVDSLPPLSRETYTDQADKHAIPEGMLDDVIANGWVYPWVLADARTLPTPVRYIHKSGAVTFATLDAEVSNAIERQLASTSDNAVQTRSKPGKPAEARRPLTPEAEPARLQPTPRVINGAPAGTAEPAVTGEFTFEPEGAHAVGRPTRSGFLVRAGSTAMREGSPRVKRDRELRDRLVRLGVLVPDVNPVLYRFSQDYEFASPSAAAGVVKDGNASGPNLWRHVVTHRTLAEMASRR